MHSLSGVNGPPLRVKGKKSTGVKMDACPLITDQSLKRLIRFTPPCLPFADWRV